MMWYTPCERTRDVKRFVNCDSPERRTDLDGLRGRIQSRRNGEQGPGRHLSLRARGSSGWAAGALIYDNGLTAHTCSRAAPTRPALVSLISFPGNRRHFGGRVPRARNLPAEHTALTGSNTAHTSDASAYHHARYDTAGQLTGATHSYQANESYSFDSNGNRNRSE